MEPERLAELLDRATTRFARGSGPFLTQGLADELLEAVYEIKRLQAVVAPLVNALDFCQGAIADAIGDEDGLDGASGYAVLKMVWPLLSKHGAPPPPEQCEAFAKMYEGDGTPRPIVSIENAELQTEAVQLNTEYLEMTELLAKRSREVKRLQAIVDREPTWAELMEIIDKRYPPEIFGKGSADNTGPRIVALCREIERLNAIVEKLPKCWRLVDGKLVRDCPVVPGMTVWFFTLTGALTSDVVLRFETVGSSEYATIHTEHGWMQCVACHDTEEAAVAARVEAKDGEAC